MRNDEARLEMLSRTNPLFGPAKLKLGSFCTNVSGGATMSSMKGVLNLSWPNAAHLARLADEMTFEAIVPIGRWRGFGGDTDFNGESFESMTFAAGIAATVRKPAVFATVHVPSLHPVMAAKQATTVDHISGGRFALNVVTGWNENEIALFGSPMMEHDERYNAAAEWITLMKQLWASDDPVLFDGKYYAVKDAFLRPKPIQPYPALMSAGASPKGRAFAAEHCDVAFTSLGERDVASIRDRLNSYRELAERDFGRRIQIWINAYMIIGDTDEDAQRQYDHCVKEKGDFAGVENLLRSFKMNVQSHSPEMADKLRHDFIAGWAGYRLQGTRERIVDDMKLLADAGIDGVLLSWPAFTDGMERFQEEVHPLLVQEGLR
jgi:alkanesulfonate monooxygenase SsuD/methylene tetrahydromethanopterin reductase-like flavin-dependent oxidoreductase (luciferase family)